MQVVLLALVTSASSAAHDVVARQALAILALLSARRGLTSLLFWTVAWCATVLHDGNVYGGGMVAMSLTRLRSSMLGIAWGTMAMSVLRSTLMVEALRSVGGGCGFSDEAEEKSATAGESWWAVGYKAEKSGRE